MFKKIVIIALLGCFLQAYEYKSNDLVYSKFWNLYNGGSVAESGEPILTKAPAQQAAWNATMKLQNPKVIADKVGKVIYFITETSGDSVARLAPSFYVIKNKVTYQVWWEGNRYISFFADSDGVIKGQIFIPDPNQVKYYFQPENGTVSLVKKGAQVSPEDIKLGLRTDWQHDIPGSYDIDKNNKYLGLAGKVKFTRFYLGSKPLMGLLSDRWLQGVSEKERKIVLQEFGLVEKYAEQPVLEENEYVISEKVQSEMRKYFDVNRDRFNSDPYFLRPNILSGGDTFRGWQIIANAADFVGVKDGYFVVKGKREAKGWVIAKVSDLNRTTLQELAGPVRLSFDFDVQGLQGGDYPWQTVFVEVVQRDAKGQEISPQLETSVRLPINKTYLLQNYRGTVESEFVISPLAESAEVFLKVAGAPDPEPNKRGVILEQLKVRRVCLAKADGKLNLNELISNLPEKSHKEESGYLVYPSAKIAYLVGDRNFSINKQNGINLEYDLPKAESYGGIYSNVFSLKELNELELAADLGGELTKHGNPANWASNTVELSFFDENGKQVFPADYGEEKYPKISLNPEMKQQTLKNFFAPPVERGAKFGQLRIHFMRQQDSAGNYDKQNYYSGKSYVRNLVFRSSLDPVNLKNAAAFNGTFYKHINGSMLDWNSDGVKVVENIGAQSREVIFNNTDQDWSSLRTELIIPAEASAIRGRLNIRAEDIKAGMAPWEGFGFFLEADVEDEQGTQFHYTGIPVYKKEGERLIRFDLIIDKYAGEIEYFIPLYHEHLKIKKLYWQLALLGKGKVRLVPLVKGENQPLAQIEFLESGEPNNPAFWAQYGLNWVEAKQFGFYRHYELALNGRTYNYESPEALANKLSVYYKKPIQIPELKVGSSTQIADAKITALPSYARVEREFALGQAKRVKVNFSLQGGIDSRFNFKAVFLDKQGNLLETKAQRNSSAGRQDVKPDEDVFDLRGNQEEFVINVPEEFNPEKVRLIFGDNQGELAFKDVQVNLEENGNWRLVFEQQGVGNLAFKVMEVQPSGALDPRGLVALPDKPLLGIENQGSSLTGWKFKSGEYQVNGVSRPLYGFTIVGETFNKWLELHGQDKNKEQNFRKYLKEQSLIWKRWGVNTLRVHQLFSSWSGLDREESGMVVRGLRDLQGDGFFIVADLLPNTDFQGDFFGAQFKNTPYAGAMTNYNDLFKATLVLPEVRKNFVKPALNSILDLFRENHFWPDSLSYCNETGFTHGFWTIDKNNPQAFPHYTKQYYYYYARFLNQLKGQPKVKKFISQGNVLIQKHVQTEQVALLCEDLEALSGLLRSGSRVKDNATYMYYNVLRSDVIGSYPAFKQELTALRQALEPLAVKPALSEYYTKLPQQLELFKGKLELLNKAVSTKRQENTSAIKNLLTTLSSKELDALYKSVFSAPVPANYKPTVELSYIDSFNLTPEQANQSFFTSFLLPVNFYKEINATLRNKIAKDAKPRPFTIGLNNDFIRDPFMLLGNAYVFMQDNQTEIRFNKYTHHPVGGHSMRLHPGRGNVFDQDSDIDYNLRLFTPPAGYPVQLSETNYTYAGDDDAGQGVWTLFDYLKIINQKNSFIWFHLGLNNVDRPLINDYFSFGNRPFQVEMVSSLGLAKNTKNLKISADRYRRILEASGNNLTALGGEMLKDRQIGTKDNKLQFTYTGERAKSNCAILASEEGYVTVQFFGLERNNRQKNRAGNPALIDEYGAAPIVYEHVQGVVKYRTDKPIKQAMGLTPTGEKVLVDSTVWQKDKDYLIIDTAKADKRIIAFRFY